MGNDNSRRDNVSRVLLKKLILPVMILPGLAFANESTNQNDIQDSQDQVTPTSIEGNGCTYNRASDEWIDGMRASSHSRLCNTASWLDGLFGDEQRFNGEDFRGKLSIGFKQDEIDGFDPRLRVRIKTKLPNVSNRFNAFLGRVEEDNYVANTDIREDRLTSVGQRSSDDDDSEWLVGLGYRSPSKDNNGFDLSVGAKLSGGFSPYSKLAYRHLFRIADDQFWHTTQTVFWRKQDGFGVSNTAEHTKLIGDKNIWVNTGNVKYTEEAEQWEWFADSTWHHSLSDKRGISSSAYVMGEEQNPVSIPEFGLTFTYIRPILRDWLSMETGLDFRWEKDQPEQSYKSAIKFGLQFEMLLGDYYGRRKHR